MDWIYPLILIGAGLIVFSIFTTVVAFRFGAPLLLLFLCLGLIVGEDGLGLDFDDVEAAYLIGSLALAVILFDSGFNTPLRTLRRAAGPAITLATVGVGLTTLIVGAAAKWLFDFTWPMAFLVGAIVSSTDAAAVFFLLRSGGIKIYKRVRSILEVESGSNDPMAIFLTIFFIEWIVTDSAEKGVLETFFTGFGFQMGLGLLGGVLGGWLIAETVRRLQLEEALYPIAVMAAALALFALVSIGGGSGFLAVYVAGVVAGNRELFISSSLRRYQAGMTWMAQIVMFLILGLIVTPSEFAEVAVPAVALGLFLMLIGRPIAVWLCLLPFRLDRRAVTFVSWVGLRGAVSILLGIVPALAGISGAEYFLNISFLMVITSLLVQGWTLKPLARYLNLAVPPRFGPLERVNLELPGNPNHELAVYRVRSDSPVMKGKQLPMWARPSLIIRDDHSLRLQQLDDLKPGDYVYILTPPDYVPLLDQLFAEPKQPSRDDRNFFGELRVDPDQPLSELVNLYGLPEPREGLSGESIGEFLIRRLNGRPVIGDRIALGELDLVVTALKDRSDIAEVGLSFYRSNEQSTDYPRMGQWFRRFMPRGKPPE